MSGIQIIIDITLCYQNASDNMLQRIMQAEMRIIYEQKAIEEMTKDLNKPPQGKTSLNKLMQTGKV